MAAQVILTEGCGQTLGAVIGVVLIAENSRLLHVVSPEGSLVTRTVACTNVQEALEAGLATSALETLKLAICLPNSAGLLGIVPGEKRKPAFSACFERFFPNQNILPKTHVVQVLAGEVGYIGEYYEYCDAATEEEQGELQRYLLMLLGYCQCLPAWKSNNTLWYTKMLPSLGEDTIVLDTNPRLYLLELVGGGGKWGKRHHRKVPTLRSARQFQTHQLEVLHRIPRETALAAIQQLRSLKNRRWTSSAKNKRVPPKRKTRQSEGIDENQNYINYVEETEATVYGESLEQSDDGDLVSDDGSKLDSSLWG